MGVPEATMNKDNCAATGKNYVRGSRQIAAMQSVPISKPMKNPSDDQLRGCVLLPDGGHSLASLVSIQYVHQPSQGAIRKIANSTDQSSATTELPSQAGITRLTQREPT
jgi:hypothetical protein